MELNHEFRVGIPVEDAWKVLTDVERIAPHMPGAQLQEVEGDEYRGIVKVKVGPITAQYKGAATFLEQDQEAGRVVLKASGRDTRGQGNANATITATLHAEGDGTKVTVATDLTVTGKVAQFGRGVMADVSSKLLGQFVDSLEKDLQQSGGAAGASSTAGGAASPAGAPQPQATSADPAAGGAAASVATAGSPVQESSTNGATPGEPAAAGPGGPESFSAPPATGGSSTTAASPATTAAPPAAPAGAPPATSAPGSGAAAQQAPAVRKISAPEAKPVDLLGAAGGSVAKRLLPLAGLAALVFVLVMWRRRRR